MAVDGLMLGQVFFGDVSKTFHPPLLFFVHLLQIPGVPIMYIHAHRYSIERLPEATMGGAPRR